MEKKYEPPLRVYIVEDHGLVPKLAKHLLRRQRLQVGAEVTRVVKGQDSDTHAGTSSSGASLGWTNWRTRDENPWASVDLTELKRWGLQYTDAYLALTSRRRRILESG